MNQVTYQASSHKFNNFSSYIENVELKHFNLPEIFINRDKIDTPGGLPTVSFTMSLESIEKDIFKTVFNIKIDYKLSGTDIETKEAKEYHIYTLEMRYAGFTHIENSDDIPEIEKRKILLVDVAYLIFPAVRNQVFVLTRDTMSTPVNLNPINFAELFNKESAEANNNN